MTKSTAQKISNSDQPITLERKKDFRCPVTPSEVYNLGMAMEKLLGEVYMDMETRCQSQEAKKMLKSLIQQNQYDVNDFLESFKFSLNCEIGDFYRARGVILSGNMTEQTIEANKALIMRNLENFFSKINTIQKDLKTQNGSELEEHFHAKTSTDVYKIGIDVRNSTIELYDRLAKLYPEGESKKAFLEMAQIVSQGNIKLTHKL